MTVGGAACPLLSANATAACCATPAAPAALLPGATATLNLTLSTAELGDALFAAGVAGTFAYAAAPVVTSLSPAAGHVGSSVHLQGSGFTGVPEA